MSIRFSTTQYFKVNTQRMSEQQANIGKIQTQLGSDQRVLRPSDDPLAMAVALGAVSAGKKIDSYQTNLSYLNNKLEQMDATIGSSTDIMNAIKDSMLQANSGTLSASDREILAKDIEGRIDELRGLANSQDASGNYIFSGSYLDKPPFQVPDIPNGITGTFLETATPASAAAVKGSSVQVTNGRTLDAGVTGYDAFVNSSTGEDVFKILTDAVAYLRNPGYPNGQQGATAADTFRAAFTNKMTEVDQVFGDMQLARTRLGVRMREADTLTSLNTAASTEQQKVAADAVGLDYTKAITELSQAQLQLQASQQSFSTTSKLTLFNYL